MPIDHVLIAVADAGVAAEWLWRRHGLIAVEGGAHPGWGTGNSIVPLGRSDLELVRIEDPAVAAETPFGRRATEAIAAGAGPYAWCVAPTDFEATVARLGLEVREGSRRRPDGTVLAWRTAGLEVALADPSRPFFIEWHVPARAHPGRTFARHRVGEATLASLELTGDESAVRAWLGADGAAIGGPSPDAPAIRIRPGSPAITAIAIDAPDVRIVLRSADWGRG